MFALLVIEREPLRWAELPAAIASWFQDAGGMAEFAILIGVLVIISQLTAGQGLTRIKWTLGLKLLATAALVAQVFYVLLVLLWLVQGPDLAASSRLQERGLPPQPGKIAQAQNEFGNAAGVTLDSFSLQDWAFTLGGACALLAFVLPILAKLPRMRWRRIVALGLLSFKEAMHRRVVWVFCLIGIVFLFAGWFIPYKAEDQLRNYVLVVYFVMAVLLWLTASLLGAFSIPTDVRNQTIHTIVTKPVERYEIVLGRFLGYGGLLTIVLTGLTGLSLIYLVRGITEEAKKESYKARVPLFGEELSFYGTKDNKGESVGREWEYRKYLPGPNPSAPSQLRPYAYWSFHSLPQDLANREGSVPVEFTFDIFRLTKGDLNRGVFCTLTFASGHLSVPEIERQIAKMREERTQRAKQVGRNASDPKQAEHLEDELIAKYGVYENRSVEAVDYHTQSEQVPASLFKKVIEEGNRQQELEQRLRANEAEELAQARRTLPPADYKRQARARAEEQAQRAASKPYLKVLVTINLTSHNQLLGVARRDLYVLDAELPFWQNFIKGAIGMWFSMMLLLGLAVACSTYLSGIISWFVAVVLFVAGFFLDYIRGVSAGHNFGGGPMESIFRLANRMNPNAPLDESPTVNVARGGDEVYRWWMRLFLKIIPDVNRFDLTTYVGNGFDIPWGGVLVLDNLLPLLAYLLPWAVLAYYLMEQREVANPM